MTTWAPPARRPHRTTITVFNPSASPPEMLESFTVGREVELTAITDALRAAATSGARPHVLVVGSRGSGKTHLLTLAVHRVHADPDLASRLAVAWMPEDDYSVTSYRDLLRSTIDSLQAGLPDQPPPDADADLEDALLALLGDRTLVMVVENLDRIMRRIGLSGQRSLRAFLNNHQRAVVVASTPALFHGVSSHDAPFYGAFRVVPLGELSVDEGRELLLRVARLDGDDELSGYLASPQGLRRLQAVADLAGGLPRLWLLMAGCMTVDLLDELVPLFIKLLDELTPYYKARLDDLSGARAKLVISLCRTLSGAGGRRPVGAMTVKELAAATGMTEQSASKQLGELERARFVRSRKPEGGDRRTTFYEIREPLLRHCLELKEVRGKPLTLIVSVLRDWYELSALRLALAEARAGSESERYLTAALAAGTPSATSESLFSSGYPPDLLVAARVWFGDGRPVDGSVRSMVAAIVAEAVVLAARGTTADARQAVDGRVSSLPPPVMEAARRVATAAVSATAAEGVARGERPAGEVAARIADGLVAAATATERESDLPVDEASAVALLAGGWLLATGRAADARSILERTGTTASRLADDRLRLAVLAELSFALWETGARDEGRALGEQVLADRTRTLGPTDADTLAGLVTESERVLGRDHAYTLTNRHSHAWWVGQAGDAVAARELFAGVVEDRTRVLGPDHPDTLSSRHNHAAWVGQAGDPAAARDLLAALVPDCARVLGADHPHTLSSRHNHARWVAEAGDPGGARDLFARILLDRTRVLGPDHPDTLSTRRDHAWWTRQTRDPSAALELLVNLTPPLDRSTEHVVHWSATAAREIVGPLGTASEPDLVARMLALLGSPGDTALLVFLRQLLAQPGEEALDGWIIDSLVHLDRTDAICVPLAFHTMSLPTDVKRAFLRRWRHLLDGRPEPGFALAARVLRAADGLLEGDHTSLLALPPEERKLALAAARDPQVS
ncbi:MAG: tetratricopeptide repeat protein [Actinobacteria bacterium]|nr:tetratricopeptide repeat protein [Actinomycetota bacterium]